MKASEVIPIKKELLFLTKIVITMVASTAAALVLLYLFLNKPVGGSYRGAFQMIAEIYEKMNIYIAAAVLLQLIFSTAAVYLLSLFYSHKIAGPMFRLKVVLQQYMAGEAIEKVSFRKTDFIPGVSRCFTDFFGILGKRKRLLAEGEALAEQLSRETGSGREPLALRLEAVIRELEG